MKTSAQKMKDRRARLAAEGLAEYPLSVIITTDQKAKIKANPDHLAELKKLVIKWIDKKHPTNQQ